MHDAITVSSSASLVRKTAEDGPPASITRAWRCAEWWRPLGHVLCPSTSLRGGVGDAAHNLRTFRLRAVRSECLVGLAFLYIARQNKTLMMQM